jgi:hypothetical protein
MPLDLLPVDGLRTNDSANQSLNLFRSAHRLPPRYSFIDGWPYIGLSV